MSLSSAEILVMIAEIAPTTLHNVVAIGQIANRMCTGPTRYQTADLDCCDVI